MFPGLVRPYASFPLVRVAFLAALTLLLTGWTTCSALFLSCQTSVPQPQVILLSPDDLSIDTEPVIVTVQGNDFEPQSEIMGNNSPLQTRFVDSQHLQADITQQRLVSLGATPGSQVQISVMTPDPSPAMGCPTGTNSATLVLAIH
jgi:hypothetical protein